MELLGLLWISANIVKRLIEKDEDRAVDKLEERLKGRRTRRSRARRVSKHAPPGVPRELARKVEPGGFAVRRRVPGIADEDRWLRIGHAPQSDFFQEVFDTLIIARRRAARDQVVKRRQCVRLAAAELCNE